MTEQSKPRPDGEFDGRSFAELVTAGRAGDPEAVNCLISRFRSYLLLIANRDLDVSIRSKIGASDVVQQTMLAAYEHFPQFRGNCEEELIAWLKQILRNDLCSTHRHFQQTQQRDARREQPLDDSSRISPPLFDPQYTPGTNALINEQEQLVERAMQELPENYRQVVRLRNWEELSFEQIGGAIQISPEAARKLWSRAITRLAEILETRERSDRGAAGRH